MAGCSSERRHRHRLSRDGNLRDIDHVLAAWPHCQPGQLEMSHAEWILMMVMQSTTPTMKWPRASNNPKRMNQTTLPMADPAPAPGCRTIARPKGQRQNPAIRNAEYHERDGDNEDCGEESSKNVPKRHLQPAKNHPQDVPDEPQGSGTVATARSLRSHRRRQTADTHHLSCYYLPPSTSTSSARGPHVGEAGVASRHGDQGLGVSRARRSALVDHYHVIGALRRLQAVGDHHRCPVLEKCSESPLHLHLGPWSRLEVASSRTTRSGDAARRAPGRPVGARRREPAPPLAHLGVEPLGETAHPVVDTQGGAHLPDPLIVDVRPGEGDVVPKRPRKTNPLGERRRSASATSRRWPTSGPRRRDRHAPRPGRRT